MKNFQSKVWYYRWLRYEYWPFTLFYFPTLLFWIYYSLRSRSFVYISAVNPSIYLGGFFGESKKEILDLIDDRWKATTIRIEHDTDPEKLKSHLEIFSFPLIAKPDIGERGTNVRKIHSLQELKEYMKAAETDILIQEYIPYPVELGIFYYRYPDRQSGVVSSVTGKKFMQVTGNGTSTVEQLMDENIRFAFQLKRLRSENKIDLNLIPEQGQVILLEARGNHCLGTEFTNRNDLINEKLNKLMDEIAIPMKGFYFGRFDLRCNSVEDLFLGNLKIMEVNGATSEPGHIYDSKMNIWKAYKSVISHMKVAFHISRINHLQGHEYSPFSEFYSVAKQYLLKSKNA